VRFLVDNQLPKALAEWLESHSAEHLLDLGLAQEKDNRSGARQRAAVPSL
jgi:predicted nuclease of predicted toxin-antitoxin system